MAKEESPEDREQRLARKRAYRAAHPEQDIKYRDEHKAEKNARERARYAATRDKQIDRRRAYRAAHPEVEKAWNEANKDKIKASKKQNYEANKESVKAASKAWYEANKERALEYAREKRLTEDKKYIYQWRKNNPGKLSGYSAARRALKNLAMPEWVDRNAIAEIYIEARRKTEETGVQHEVDHLYPLKGIGYVGLHVPWNMRIVVREVNHAKKNRRPTTQELAAHEAHLKQGEPQDA